MGKILHLFVCLNFALSINSPSFSMSSCSVPPKGVTHCVT
uniref:Uncharacterized protein n=1 Tax=Anguilla anguilla TaxID=7936 RepID=A0A0E9Q8Z8_ANGAN